MQELMDSEKLTRSKTQRKVTTVKKRDRQVQSKTSKKAKDELEYATNWRRAFINIYQHIKWLNAYAKINHIAEQKYSF